MAKSKSQNGEHAADDARTTPSDRGDRPVVVTTAHRGVFFGYARRDHVDEAPAIRIERARNCIHWASSVGGFMGLAAGGPNAACRVGAQVPAITLREVTSVIDCSPEATRAWEAAPCVK